MSPPPTQMQYIRENSCGPPFVVSSWIKMTPSTCNFRGHYQFNRNLRKWKFTEKFEMCLHPVSGITMPVIHVTTVFTNKQRKALTCWGYSPACGAFSNGAALRWDDIDPFFDAKQYVHNKRGIEAVPNQLTHSVSQLLKAGRSYL